MAAAAALGKRLGFEAMELGGVADDGSLSLLLRNAETTKKTLDEADMRVCVLATTICLHHADEARWQRAKLLITRAVEMAVYLGAPVVRVLGHEVGRGEGRSAVIGRIGAHLREAAEDADYARAAAAFMRWRAEGVLVREAEPSLYLVDQTYRGPDGRERTRKGFIARLRLADFAERVVLPHERTHAGAKVDRLRLYRAARADLSQIFLLCPDDDGGLEDALAAAAGAACVAAAREARDGDGNLRRGLLPRVFTLTGS